jgi:hypothetical protein
MYRRSPPASLGWGFHGVGAVAGASGQQKILDKRTKKKGNVAQSSHDIAHSIAPLHEE